MKVVVFGPENRVGILDGDNIVDASLAYAALAASRGERLPQALAAAIVPPNLERFIAAGAA